MSDFKADLDKMYAFKLSNRDPSARARLGLWLRNSEFHCVACYRLGQYAVSIRPQHKVLGTLLAAIHKVWNRWVTHIHHADLSGNAKIGPGLLIMHRYGIIIGPSEIGSNCLIHQNVTIGQRVAGGDQGVPRIGNDVWIGPGSIISGAITIGDGAVISAGTVLSRDVPAGALAGGNPGRVIAKDYDATGMRDYKIPPELLAK